MTALGVAGNLTRSLVFAGAGAFMIDTAVRFDPSAANGIDATLRPFAHTPLSASG